MDQVILCGFAAVLALAVLAEVVFSVVSGKPRKLVKDRPNAG